MAGPAIDRQGEGSLWPWVIGLVILALLIWGIAELVNTDRDNSTMVEAGGTPQGEQVPNPAVAPKAAPARAAAVPEPPPAPLAALMPMGVQDAGQRVTAAGDALTGSANGGYWLHTDNDVVIWVRSPRTVRAGQDVPTIVGVLEPARAGQPGASASADVQAELVRRHWATAPGLFLDASPRGETSGRT